MEKLIEILDQGNINRMFGLFRGQKRNFILGRKVIPSRFQLLIVADSRVAIRRDPRKFNRASSSPVNLDPANRTRSK